MVRLTRFSGPPNSQIHELQQRCTSHESVLEALLALTGHHMPSVRSEALLDERDRVTIEEGTEPVELDDLDPYRFTLACQFLSEQLRAEIPEDLRSALDEISTVVERVAAQRARVYQWLPALIGSDGDDHSIPSGLFVVPVDRERAISVDQEQLIEQLLALDYAHITYTNASGRTSRRVIRPYGTVDVDFGIAFVACYDHTNGSPQRLMASRISEITSATEADAQTSDRQRGAMRNHGGVVMPVEGDPELFRAYPADMFVDGAEFGVPDLGV